MSLRPALRLAAAFIGALVTLPACAAWTLDPARSELSFVTVKAGDIAEVHRFGTLEGGVSDGGEAVVRIALVSVDTHIPVRDERMRAMLFETERFPTATLTARLPANALDLPAGASVDLPLEGKLDLHGASQPLKFTVTAMRLSDGRVVVASRQPLIVTADQFALTAGVEKLREVAKLPAISKAVPVSFVLEFVTAK